MRWTSPLVGLCLALSGVAPLKAEGAEVMRSDFSVESDPTIHLAVREVTAPNVTPVGPPVILIHGARVPGIASFDLNVRNGSLAVELATARLRVFVMDARGYGGSTRTGQVGDPAGRPPLARSDEIVRDIGAVAKDVRKRTPTSGTRNPPSFRAPMGAMADSFELASGRKLWDASWITARVLLLRSEYDFWSRAADLTDLAGDLINARSVKAETLLGATHYAHLRLAQTLARYGNARRDARISAAPDRERDEHLQPQSDHDRRAVLIPRHAPSPRSGGRGLAHQGAREAAAGAEP